MVGISALSPPVAVYGLPLEVFDLQRVAPELVPVEAVDVPVDPFALEERFFFLRGAVRRIK